MIQGKKGVAGYFSTFNSNGRKVEGETRMCAHCQFKWQYSPGSGVRRGFCKRCNGLLCGQDLCMKYCIPYMSRIESMEKGLKLDEMIKAMDKKDGEKLLGQTNIVIQ